ncbi:mechanosensitive ion channel family protein [Halococcus qingdaonensis]|uniref:mechanosensitive ion channel family protein n=1 Tax=Halococcus qingdaonensis TaxID=224402 RepID=UPI002115D9CB|nr:phosphatase [Halococcus qingdaonensis]
MTETYTIGDSIVLQTVPDSVQPLIEGFLSAIPSIIAAIVILIIGWIVGIVLGNAVKRVIRSISPSQYVSGTPLEPEGDADESLAGGLGKLVKYIIIIFALLLALQQLQLPIPGDILSSIVSAVLKIVVAAIILGVGFAIGRFVGDIIGSVLGGFNLNRYLEGTPLVRITDAVGGVGNALGTVVEYVIYYFALVQAVDALQFGVLTQMFTGLTAYLPVLIGALIFLLIGIYVADLLGDVVADINTSQVTDYAGLGVKVFAYYYVITTVLSRLGLGVDILETLFNTVVVSFFGALGVGLALAIAIGLGWGSKDYVAENIDSWMSSARSSADDLTEGGGTTGHTQSTDDEDMFDDDTRGGSGPSGTGDPDV